MLVTIIADASWCPHTGAAGYGAWIATDRGKQNIQGPMKIPVKCSKSAEMMALVNAVYQGIKDGLIESFDVVILQSDCLFGLRTFQGTHLIENEHDALAKEYLEKYVKLLNLTVTYKHVKGHTNRQEARYRVNNMCDENAKKHMRKMRSRLKLKAIRDSIDANP